MSEDGIASGSWQHLIASPKRPPDPFSSSKAPPPISPAQSIVTRLSEGGSTNSCGCAHSGMYTSCCSPPEPRDTGEQPPSSSSVS